MERRLSTFLVGKTLKDQAVTNPAADNISLAISAPTAATTARLYIPSSIEEKKKPPTGAALLLRERRLARRPLPVSLDVVAEHGRCAEFDRPRLQALFEPSPYHPHLIACRLATAL